MEENADRVGPEGVNGFARRMQASRLRDFRPDILIVDDDATLREGLIELFRLEGRRAVGAATGGEALFLLEKGITPRVILLDLDMPVMNGWEFVSALERVPTLPRIPIAIVSGISSGRGIPLPESDAGFFRKPVNFDALLVALSPHLPPR